MMTDKAFGRIMEDIRKVDESDWIKELLLEKILNVLKWSAEEHAEDFKELIDEMKLLRQERRKLVKAVEDLVEAEPAELRRVRGSAMDLLKEIQTV